MDKNYAVLGIGKFGLSVALALADNGADVLVADGNEEKIDYYSQHFTYAMVADLEDSAAIQGLGLSNMDVVVVAMALDLKASIMCVMIAKEEGVPRVIAKAADHRMGEILTKVGADEIVYPEEESGIRTAKKIISDNFLDFFDLSEDTCIIEMRPKEEWIGKCLKELRLRNRYDINVAAIWNKGKMTTAIDPDVPLTAENKLLVIANKNKVKKLK